MGNIPAVGTKWQADVVRLTHPDYENVYNQLRFGRESYEGSGGYAPWLDQVTIGDTWPDDQKAGSIEPKEDRRTYLFKHPREKTKFKRRVMMAYPSNVIKRSVQALVGYLTVKKPNYIDWPQETIDWQRVVTVDGDSWEQFKEHSILPSLCYYGVLPVLFRREPTDAITAVNQSPLYAEIICPENIVDWQVAEYGQFEWLKIKVEIDATKPLDEKRVTIDRYIYYTQYGWFSIDDDKNSTELVVGASGEYENGLPIVTWSLRGGALTADANAIQRELYNVNSLVQEQERETAFAMLAMHDKGGEKPSLKVTGDNVLWWDGDFGPEWMAPPPTVLEHLMNKRDVLRTEISETLGLDFDKGGGQTGMAFQFKMSKIVRQLQGLANAFSRSDAACMRRVSMELGRPVSDTAQVEYPREFDARDVEKTNNMLKDILERVHSRTARIRAQSYLCELAMRNVLSEDDNEAISEELNEHTPEGPTSPGQSTEPSYGAHGDGADGLTEATEDSTDDTRSSLQVGGE